MKGKWMLLFFIITLLTTCSKEYSAENQPPVAVAGPDQIINLPAIAVLDGSQSYDPGGGPLSFYWQQIDGPSQVVFSTVDSAHSELSNLATGIFNFELKVTDATGLEDKDTIQLTIQSSGNNLPPVAKAGIDQQLALGITTTVFNGTASTDPDGTIVSFAWLQLSGPAPSTIVLPTQAITNVMNLVTGSYLFQLTVTDNAGAFAKDTIVITIGSTGINLPPVAIAGPDQVLPSGMVATSLNGNSSFDPDGTISSYAWIQISGPSASLINTPSLSITTVNGLQPGLYFYQLTVTDNLGAIGKDTVQVQSPSSCFGNRPLVQAQLVPFASLSIARSHLSAASVDNKILFAGGGLSFNYSTRVDIYDINSNSWSQSELSIGREGMAIASGNGRVYFAGGVDNSSIDLVLSRVDIYQANTNTWTTTELSQARAYAAAAIAANKLVVAGGGIYPATFTFMSSNRVDILDLSANTWSVNALSVGRYGLSGNTVGNKIGFSGGALYCCNGASSFSPVIEWYDATNGSFSFSWSDSLTLRRAYMASLTSGNKVILAGGYNNYQPVAPSINLTDVVEIYDVAANTKEVTCLSQPNGRFQAVQKYDEIIFFTKNLLDDPLSPYFDIYNLTTKTWKIGQLPFQLNGAAIISVNNEIYVAGGLTNGVATNKVWKLIW